MYPMNPVDIDWMTERELLFFWNDFEKKTVMPRSTTEVRIIQNSNGYRYPEYETAHNYIRRTRPEFIQRYAILL